MAGYQIGLLYPDLSYRIVGASYDVFNDLGPHHRERTYQRVLGKAFTETGLHWKEQVYVPVKYRDEIVGTHYLDFLVEDTVVVELKCCEYVTRKEIQQVVEYLQITGHRLAILILFTSNGVRLKRIVHPSLLTVRDA
jgi:GxxExxY protein